MSNFFSALLLIVVFFSKVNSRDLISEYTYPEKNFSYKFFYNDSSQLERIENENDVNTITTYLFYNDSKQLVRDSVITASKFSTSKYTLVALYYYDSPISIEKKIFYNIDTLGKRTKGKAYHKYTYKQGKLVKIEYMLYDNPKPTYIISLQYDNESGNVSEIYKENPSTKSLTKIKNIYDNKINPFAEAIIQPGWLLTHSYTNLEGFDFAFTHAKNNLVTSITEFYKNNELQRSERYTSSYQYTSKGLPISRTIRWWQSHLIDDAEMPLEGKATFSYVKK